MRIKLVYILESRPISQFSVSKYGSDNLDLLSELDYDKKAQNKLETKICKKYTNCDDWKTRFDILLNKSKNTSSKVARTQYQLEAYRTLLTCFDSIEKTPENIEMLQKIRTSMPIGVSGDLGEIAKILSRLIGHIGRRQDSNEYEYDGRPGLDDAIIAPIPSSAILARSIPRRRDESEREHMTRVGQERQRRMIERRNILRNQGM